MARPRSRLFRLRFSLWRAIAFPVAAAAIRLAFSTHPGRDVVARVIVLQTLTRLGEDGCDLVTLATARSAARGWGDHFWPAETAIPETQA